MSETCVNLNHQMKEVKQFSITNILFENIISERYEFCFESLCTFFKLMISK